MLLKYWTVVLAVSFLVNAIAKADDIKRGDIQTAIQAAQAEKELAEKALKPESEKSQNDSAVEIANLDN